MDDDASAIKKDFLVSLLHNKSGDNIYYFLGGLLTFEERILDFVNSLPGISEGQRCQIYADLMLDMLHSGLQLMEVMDDDQSMLIESFMVTWRQSLVKHQKGLRDLKGYHELLVMQSRACAVKFIEHTFRDYEQFIEGVDVY